MTKVLTTYTNGYAATREFKSRAQANRFAIRQCNRMVKGVIDWASMQSSLIVSVAVSV